jgi:protein SCO1/2
MTRVLLAPLSLLLLGAAVPAAPATPVTRQQPPAARAVGVEEHIGARVPTDLPFTDAQHHPVRLGDVLLGDRPVLLVLAYARCEMLCSVVLQSVAAAASGMKLVPGRDYRPVVVSIDPHETPDEAARRQTTLLERVGQAGAPSRWPFLVGSEASVRALADALGFHYAYDPASRQFAHPAVVFVLTPDGRIARYLYGVAYGAEPLARALGLAGRGLLQPTAAADASDQLLACFRFEAGATRHAAQIQRYFRAGAFVVFGLLASLVGGLVLWERRRRP